MMLVVAGLLLASTTSVRWADRRLPYRQGMVWNGTEISEWNMEDARMEWNGRFQKWNGRQSSKLAYQFLTRICALYSQKNTPSTWATLNAGVTLNTSLKQTLFSVKYFSRPIAVSY